MKPLGSNLDVGHSDGACWMRLTRGENGTRTVAPVWEMSCPHRKT